MLGMKFNGAMSPAQVLTSACMLIALIGGGYWWVFEKDQQARDQARQYADTQKQLIDLGNKIDGATIAQTKALADARTEQTKELADQAVTTAAQISGLSSYLSKLDGKLEAYGASQQALGSRVDRLSDKVDRIADDQKGDRQDRVTFQAESDRHLNSVDARVRVLECMRGGKC